MSPKPEASYRWVMLLLGWLLYFSFGLSYTAVAPLVAPIMKDLDLNYTQMGAITGAWQLVYIFSAQPLGLITDRLGVHKSLLLGAFIMPISSMLRGFSTSFEALFASVALFGIGGPMVSIGTPKLVSLWFSGRERGIASGINASGSSVGSMAALGLTNSYILPLMGNWRGVFNLYGILSLAIALVWIPLGKQLPPQRSRDDETKIRDASKHSTLGQLLRNRTIWLLVSIGVVFFLTTHSLQNWLPRILEQKGFPPVEAGYATSLMAFSGILGSLIVPRFTYGLKRMPLTIAAVLLVSGLSILIVGFSLGFILWSSIVSSGFFTRALMPVLTVTLMNMPEVGPERMGTVGGLFFSMGEIGGFLGPFAMGYLRDATGSFVAGTIFLACVTWAAILVTPLLRTKKRI